MSDGNKNMDASNGTLSGTPVTWSPHFGKAQEWVVQNLDSSNSIDVSFAASTAQERVAPRQIKRINIYTDAITVNASSADYQVIATETPKSCDLNW
jgi:hypothetical protein